MITYILAAGKGTRMQSNLPKVMAPLAGLPMIEHVLRLARNLTPNIVPILGPDMKMVEQYASPLKAVIQHDRLGTGHAMQVALKETPEPHELILVLYGDTPLLTLETIEALLTTIKNGSDLALIGFKPENPGKYGRIICDDGGCPTTIREANDASEEELKNPLCNSGVMAFRGALLQKILPQLSNDNKAGEYYLTDTVALARENGFKTAMVLAGEEEVLGVNSREELAKCEGILQNRLRTQHMKNGVTLVDPKTTYFSLNCTIGRDTIIHPNVVIEGSVEIGENVEIRPFSHLHDVVIKDNARVGPFARLRPDTLLHENTHVGSFVEIKKSTLHHGAKANHLSYIGDADVGEQANIGAGTITCNYDGKEKHQTTIGKGAFIGSNTALVAPVTIGDGAYVGAGSTITKNVENETLAIARAKQTAIVKRK